MANQGFKTWRCGLAGPSTLTELREALTALAKQKRGTKLLSENFLNDNIFAGQSEDTAQLATMLAKVPAIPGNTILLSSLEATAQKEVVNWIAHVPDKAFNYSGGVWKVAATGNMAKALKAYDFATVDLAALGKLSGDDIVRKSGNWLTEFSKKPRVACRFGKDGTPLIYQLDY